MHFPGDKDAFDAFLDLRYQIDHWSRGSRELYNSGRSNHTWRKDIAAVVAHTKMDNTVKMAMPWVLIFVLVVVGLTIVVGAVLAWCHRSHKTSAVREHVGQQ